MHFTNNSRLRSLVALTVTYGHVPGVGYALSATIVGCMVYCNSKTQAESQQADALVCIRR